MNVQRWPWVGCVALVIALFLATPSLRAVIMRLTPLEEVLRQGEFIFTARVDRLDPDKPSAVLEVDESLKGKAPFTRLPINLTGDAEAKKLNHTPQLLKRLAPKLPLVVFVVKQGKQYIAFAYTNGTWFQMTAQDSGAENPVWALAHCEPYLRRTFRGTTEEMKQAVVDGLSGKKAPPKPDPRAEPGLGPPVQTEDRGSRIEDRAVSFRSSILDPRSSTPEGPLFAVIPSVAIGGVLSLLAMLFPAVFGGLTGQLRRWLAVITVVSLNSTLLFVHDWYAASLQGYWWGTPTGLWVSMTVITTAGLLWAWRRHLASGNGVTRTTVSPALAVSAEHPLSCATTGITASGPPVASPLTSLATPPHRQALTFPDRSEHILLWVLSSFGLALIGLCLWWNYPLRNLPWSFVLAVWIGIWTGSLYVLSVRLRGERPAGQPVLSSEGVMLWAMMLSGVGLGLSAAPASSAGFPGAIESGEVIQPGPGRHGAGLLGEAWTFVPDGQGFIASSPLVEGERVYAAVAHGSAFRPFGKLYCVERATGKLLWTFDNDGAMKQVFSTPCVADGRLYIGEGFHQDFECKLYCLDAATGKKLWAFPTRSHTESSPVVADGKVYFGAGDDGLFCLDAATGKELWHFDDGLHIDSNPAVVDNRLYAGSGVGDVHKRLELICLDTRTGAPLWRVPGELPVWGSPAVYGDHVYFGLGNGNFLFSDDKPAGALMCLQAKDGKRVWHRPVRDGVLCRPAVDAHHVYFGSRDGYVYCLDRQEGREVWKQDLGGAVVASPALVPCRCCPASTSLYVVGTNGRVACLDPATGAAYWNFDLTRNAAQLLSSPAVVTFRTDRGERRRIFFGAGINGGVTAVLYCLEDEWHSGGG